MELEGLLSKRFFFIGCHSNSISPFLSLVSRFFGLYFYLHFNIIQIINIFFRNLGCVMVLSVYPFLGFAQRLLSVGFYLLPDL